MLYSCLGLYGDPPGHYRLMLESKKCLCVLRKSTNSFKSNHPFSSLTAHLGNDYVLLRKYNSEHMKFNIYYMSLTVRYFMYTVQ